MDGADELALYSTEYHVACKYACKEKDYLSESPGMCTTTRKYLYCIRCGQIFVLNLFSDERIVSTDILASFQINKVDSRNDSWQLFGC